MVDFAPYGLILKTGRDRHFMLLLLSPLPGTAPLGGGFDKETSLLTQQPEFP
jgi:hypothetical protein